MMDISRAIYLVLRSDAGIAAALTGSISPRRLPQTSRETELVYRFEGFDGELILNTASTGPNSQRLVVSSFGKGANGSELARALDAAVRVKLKGFYGTVIDTEVSPEESVKLKAVFLVDAGEDEELTTKTVEQFSVFQVRY